MKQMDEIDGTDEMEVVRQVLVAEDDEANRFLMELILDDIGCKFDIVSDGEEAVKAVSEKVYDVVFMDIRMPNMNGIEAARKIRLDLKQKITIVAVSAYATDDIKQECVSVGMDGFITKPFGIDNFKKEIRKWLHKVDE